MEKLAKLFDEKVTLLRVTHVVPSKRQVNTVIPLEEKTIENIQTGRFLKLPKDLSMTFYAQEEPTGEMVRKGKHTSMPTKMQMYADIHDADSWINTGTILDLVALDAGTKVYDNAKEIFEMLRKAASGIEVPAEKKIIIAQ